MLLNVLAIHLAWNLDSLPFASRVHILSGFVIAIELACNERCPFFVVKICDDLVYALIERISIRNYELAWQLNRNTMADSLSLILGGYVSSFGLVTLKSAFRYGYVFFGSLRQSVHRIRDRLSQ